MFVERATTIVFLRVWIVGGCLMEMRSDWSEWKIYMLQNAAVCMRTFIDRVNFRRKIS